MSKISISIHTWVCTSFQKFWFILYFYAYKSFCASIVGAGEVPPQPPLIFFLLL